MNYFELFDIPVTLFPDIVKLKETYYRLSKKYHPDINKAADPAAYVEVLEMSGIVNTAYKTLSKLDSRLKYILESHDELKDGNEALDPEFLMEMMDLNEKVMEARVDEKKKAAALEELEQRNSALADSLKACWDQVEEGAPSPKQLDQLKNIYYQRKYLLRVRHNLIDPKAL